MGMPRRVSTKGREGVPATITITTCQGQVWMSIVPAFTWEAIMEPGTVDELIHALGLARDEAKQPGMAVAEIPSDTAPKALPSSGSAARSAAKTSGGGSSACDCVSAAGQ